MPGRTGRRALPTRLKLLRGETRPSRRGRGDEPSPVVARPRRPSCLSAYAAAEWERLCRLLLPLRVLTVADAPILEATARAYQHMREAEDAVCTEGAYQRVTTKGGDVMVRQHPALAVRAESWRRYVMGLSHFGLSPSTRTKVVAAPPETPGSLKRFLAEERFFGDFAAYGARGRRP